jgi:hypothetical protein
MQCDRPLPNIVRSESRCRCCQYLRIYGFDWVPKVKRIEYLQCSGFWGQSWNVGCGALIHADVVADRVSYAKFRVWSQDVARDMTEIQL